jgi:RNA polymerase sigma-70 factor (ECF subfamily)
LGKEEFKRLFDTHFDAIRRYLYYRCSDTELASDVAQDLFTRIWEKQMDIDPLKDKALLYKMASDMIVSKFRRKKIEMNYGKRV